ncbi:hypothetical protein BKA70DRAFT_1123458 [Coprinopsis sp. MPI-PUGE-AT-0042]|nr:hypothetical protein BKA70DRAFT_1123458 [Coprinopsis sp. MPI-PUGE-AT-0042]
MPCTPSLRRCRSSLEPDPDLYTPSKRMRALYTSIASTSSGSFLVSTDKLTSATPIIAPVLEATPSLAQPDWSMADRPTTASTLRELQRKNEMLKAQLQQAQVVDRAKDGIIEGCHATMVIQNFHLIKQNGALHGKELQKTSNRTSTLDTSRGQCYSTEEVLADLRAKRARKEAEEARKKAGRDVRAARKEAKAQIEAEWARIKSQHAENCEAWKKACNQLKSEGVPKKEWPKAPTRPRKPTIPVHFGAVEEVEDDDDEEEEEMID